MQNNGTKLGCVPTEVGMRDATHQPVLAVTAGETLQPGQWVKLVQGLAYAVPASAGQGDAPGIVDPFRSGVITRGVVFWLCLRADLLNGLHHSWTSAVLGNDDACRKALEEGFLQTDAERRLVGKESEEYLRGIADADDGVSYEELLAHAIKGDDIPFEGFIGEEIDKDLFWQHVEHVTGKRFAPAHRNQVDFLCCGGNG